MGREVRRVPKDWQHPKDDRGRFIPLRGGSVSDRQRRWDEESAQWERGYVRSFRAHDEDKSEWVRKDPDLTYPFEEWDGKRPVAEDFMPDWPESERTHFQMYEDTSEGTPISPAFATPEELARWLADNNASTFADLTTDYETWLRMIRGPGWAPSMIMTGGVIRSGVDAMAEKKH
jgi:hypothetical protein